jgi:hypothetical protein
MTASANATVAALLRRHRSLAPMAARRDGQIRLMPQHEHVLVVMLPFGHLILSRDDCEWLKQSLGAPSFRHLVEVKLPATSAYLSAEDADWVLQAIAAFERELAVEDRRSEDRLHPHVTPVEV